MDPESEHNIEPEIAEYPEAGPYWVGLWTVARHWVGWLADIFEPDVIAGPGITRRFALRCRNWLWPIEGLVRRLIIAAAMKLDPAHLPKLVAGRKRPSKPTTPASSVSFAVLPHITGRRPLSSPKAQPAKPQEHRHIGFPGDDLMRLFPRSDRRNARPVYSGSLHPLHRRGRRSRWDPDYEGSGAANTIREGDVASFMLHGRSLSPLEGRARPEPRPRTRADRSSPYWKPPGGDVPEWKRLEQEWERVIPSRGLAGRISALIRVMQAPERWIARTARKLSADLVARLRAVPPPGLKKPKLDRSPSGFLEEPLGRSHALIDTS